MDKKPEETQQPTDADQADDVEGHSLALVLGLGQAQKNRSHDRGKKPADDALPPLKKTFPRMRDEKQP